MSDSRPPPIDPGAPGCPGCGADIRPDARFCPRCGAALPVVAGRPPPPPRLEPEPAPIEGERTPRTPGFADRGVWARFRPVLWMFGLLVLASAAGAVTARLGGGPMPGIVVGVTVLHAAICVAFAWSERESIVPALKRLGLSGRNLLATEGLLVGLAIFMFVYVSGLEAVGFPTIRYLELFESHGWPMWSACVLVCVCPAVFEELGFRGFIQGRLEGILGPRDAIVLQAALFSIVHLAPVSLVSHFVLGLAFGWLRRRTGSLVPGMLLHGAWNALVLLKEVLIA